MAIIDRYPNADVLAQRGHWDEATRRVVLDRVENPPPFRNFQGHERATLEALCDRVIPQEHHPPERRVPIAPWIDQNYSREQVGGFTFDDMPFNPEAWDLGLQGLDQTSQALFGADFIGIDAAHQDQALESIRAGDPPGDVWQKLPARRWWIYVALRQITGVYYSHPFAWDEIGFGGPAYPRGYAALSDGHAEPWEARELRYDSEGEPKQPQD